MVGSGTTTVWCGVTFVPNLLLLFLHTEHMRTQHSKEKPFVCNVDGCGYKTGDSGNFARKLCVVVDVVVTVVHSSYVGCWLVRKGKSGY